MCLIVCAELAPRVPYTEELNGRLDVPGVPGLPDTPAGLLIPRLLTLFTNPTPSVKRQTLGKAVQVDIIDIRLTLG